MNGVLFFCLNKTFLFGVLIWGQVKSGWLNIWIAQTFHPYIFALSKI